MFPQENGDFIFEAEVRKASAGMLINCVWNLCVAVCPGPKLLHKMEKFNLVDVFYNGVTWKKDLFLYSSISHSTNTY